MSESIRRCERFDDSLASCHESTSDVKERLVCFRNEWNDNFMIGVEMYMHSVASTQSIRTSQVPSIEGMACAIAGNSCLYNVQCTLGPAGYLCFQ